MENSKEVLQLDFGFDIKPMVNQKTRPKTAKQAQNDFVFEFMDSLTAPVIVFPSAWQDTIPKDVLKNITMSRLLCQISGEQMASYTEVVAYMMPRTFESPLQSEWVNIYTWCGLQYTRQFKGKELAKTMEEIAPKNLSDYEMRLLNDLRQWIYEKRRKALKQSMSIQKITEPKTMVPEQKTLF